MRYYREVPMALLAGAVTGALVLGITGRAATAAIALISGNTLNLNLRVALEVVIVGYVLDYYLIGPRFQYHYLKI